MLIDKLKNSKTASNAGWIIACKVCKAVLTIVATMIVSRYLGAEKYGVLSYAASLVAFVTPIMKLGLNEVLVHEIVVHPEREGRTLGTSIALNVVSAIICSFGIIAFAYIANGDEKDTLTVCSCYCLVLLFQAMEMIFYWFQAKLKAKYTSVAILVAYAVVVVIQVVLVTAKADVYCFAVSYSLEYLIIALILIFCYKREGTYKLSVSFNMAKHLWNEGRFYIVSGLMVMIFSQTDKIMLKLMCTDEVVGIYSAAATCAGMTSFVFVAIIDSFRPAIFASYNDTRIFERKMRTLYSIIIWFSLIQCIVITAASPLIIRILYGAGYVEAVNVLRIVVWFTTFSYLGTIRNIWILPNNCQKYLGWINTLGAVMNIVLNLLLIPQFGATGAAVASVIAQFFTNVVVGYIIQPIRPNNKLMIDAVNPKHIINLVRDDI